MNRVLIAACLMGVTPSLVWAEGGKDWSTATVQLASETPGQKAESGRIDPLAGSDVALTRKERKAVAYGKQWANNRDQPARGEDGSAVFVFGATLPTVVCAPLYVCDFVLQPGETVNDLHVGDAVRWQIAPATQGAGEASITHIIIKPTDIGLTTNMLVTTNRRAYTVKLVSRSDAWMPRISFQYPDATQASWNTYRIRQDQGREEREAEATPDALSARVDYSYSISGDASWRPVRAYAAGGKTIIQFPHTIGQSDLPALVSLADDGGLFTEPTKELVNYRFVKDRFVIDRVLDRAALISGVGGDQIKIELKREGKN